MISAGADELYCSVVEGKWLDQGFCSEDHNAEQRRVPCLYPVIRTRKSFPMSAGVFRFVSLPVR